MNRATLYSNVLVKIGVERSYLLSESKLKALARCKNFYEFISELKDTLYREGLAKVTPPYTSLKFQRIFRENLVKVYCKLVRNSPEKISQLLKTCLLKVEHENIKTVLKAISIGLPYEEIMKRIYMFVEGFLGRRELIEKAATAIHVKSAIDSFKKTVYEPVLNVGLRKYEETRSTKVFDILLDKMFYERLGEAFRDLPKREQKYAIFYVSTETDGFNLLTILRSKILNYGPHWIRMAISHNFYNVKESTVEALLMAKDFESAFNMIKKCYYSEFFVKAETPEETVSQAEESFRKAIIKHAKKTKVGDLFNIGTVLGFIVEKEAEVHNLTAISLGVENSWKPDEIERALLL